MKKHKSTDNDVTKKAKVSQLNDLTIKSKEENQVTENSFTPNSEFFYRGNDIVKLWEQYLKNWDQEIKFCANDHNGNIEIIHSIFNDLTQNKEASLVLRPDETLYLNKDKKSISLCGEI